MMDATDVEILNIIQNQGRISNAELARRLAMAPSGVLERVKKLEKRGVILGYEARLAPEKLGRTLTAFIEVLSSDAVGSTAIGSRLAEIPGVLEVHWIAGKFNYLVKCRLKVAADLTDLLKTFGTIAGVRDTRTTLVLETIKETQAIPLERQNP